MWSWVPHGSSAGRPCMSSTSECDDSRQAQITSHSQPLCLLRILNHARPC